MSATDALTNRDRYCDLCGSELEWEDHIDLHTPDEWFRFCGWDCLAAYTRGLDGGDDE